MIKLSMNASIASWPGVVAITKISFRYDQQYWKKSNLKFFLTPYHIGNSLNILDNHKNT